MFAPAPALAPTLTLESAFLQARALATAPIEDPISILERDAAPTEKLSAIEALHRSMPTAPQARRTKALEALRRAAASIAEAPAVRALALAHLGYAVPIVGDAASREAAVKTLLAAARDSAFRVHALRGLSAASHNLPEKIEGEFQSALLDLP